MKRIENLMATKKEQVDPTVSLLSIAQRSNAVKSNMITSIEMNFKSLEETISSKTLC